jgi:hypothetical protein
LRMFMMTVTTGFPMYFYRSDGPDGLTADWPSKRFGWHTRFMVSVTNGIFEMRLTAARFARESGNGCGREAASIVRTQEEKTVSNDVRLQSIESFEMICSRTDRVILFAPDHSPRSTHSVTARLRSVRRACRFASRYPASIFPLKIT